MNFDIATAALLIFPLLLAVVCHEWAHGYVAYRFGDRTAASMGRLTLNPIPHIDPFGTILMPGILLLTGAPILFGYAKPVPVVWQNLRNPVRDMVYVAAAGPAMNLVLAIVSALALGIMQRTGVIGGEAQGFAVAAPLAAILFISVKLNVVLAVFNLLPIPPLDGGRVAVGLLPPAAAEALARVEPYGFMIVFALLLTGVLGTVMGPIINMVIGLLLTLF